MNSLVLLIAISSLGVDYGWQTLPDGSLEYIIQIEPEQFELVKQGGDIVSYLKPEIRDVRRFRIVVGKGELPQEEIAAEAKYPVENSTIHQETPAPRAPTVSVNSNEMQLKDAFHAESRNDTEKPENPLRVDGSRYSTGNRQIEDPKRLELNTETKPLDHQQASFNEPILEKETQKEEDPPPAPIPSPSDQPITNSEQSKPWVPFVFALLGLFASLGGNAYLGWLFFETQRRYQAAIVKQ